MTNSEPDLETRANTPEEILHASFIDLQTTRLCGYAERVKAMCNTFHEAGYSDAYLVAVASQYPLNHRAGAYLNYHLVVVLPNAALGDIVYDPLCQEPVPLKEYVPSVFGTDADVGLFRETKPRTYKELVTFREAA